MSAMNPVALEFPMLVEPIAKQGYRLQPLLFPGDKAMHKRYARAVDGLRKAVRRRFKDVELERENLPELLWHTFHPQFHFQLKSFQVRCAKRWLQGAIAVAFYQLDQARYACFPKLDHHTIMLSGTDDEEQLFQAVQHFFRALSRDAEPAGYWSGRNETTAIFQTSIQIQPARFPFAGWEQGYYAMRRQQRELKGSNELARVGHDLNEDYPDELAQAYLRQALAGEIRELIYQPHPSCLAIVGPRGCGKTTLVQAAVRTFLHQHEGKDLNRLPKVWYLDPLRVISGMSVVGMWQRRMQVIIDHLHHRLWQSYRIRRTDQLYVDNAVALFRIGKSAQNNLTLADVLKPCLEQRSLGMILEATPEEWQKVQGLDRKFADLFQVLRIEEPDQSTAVRMLTWQRARLEHSNNCRFSSEALNALWDLRGQMAGDEVLPGSMVRIMHQLAVRFKEQNIDQQAVYADYQASHKYRQSIFDPEIPLEQDTIQAHLDRHLIGQNQAKRCLADTVQLIKARLAAPDRPLAALLFIGPTGVGKTEAAKVLADFLFVDKAQLVRFDMNEYVDGEAVSRLLGDQFRPQGQLTARVRQQRACVLLLDEIEKAHPQVHDLLLQVLGEGRLSDAMGRTTDFSQCVIIMTSNLGASEAARTLGYSKNEDDRGQTYVQAVERFFRPEFLNRIDEQVVFQALTLAEAVGLTRIQIRRLLARDGFVRRTVFVNIDQQTLEHVARSGFEPNLGGRALKRNIERALTTLAADQLVSMAPDRPLLLDIAYRDGLLLPHIRPLEYHARQEIVLSRLNPQSLAEAFPEFAQELEPLETQINTAIDAATSSERMQLWLLKERLIDLKGTLSDICWDVQQWRQGGCRTPFRVRRRCRLNPAWRLAESCPQIQDDWNAYYTQAKELDALCDPFYLQLRMEYRLIQRLLRARLDAEACAFDLVLEPCTEQGEREVEYLSEHYRALLDDLDVNPVRLQREGARVTLRGEGYGIGELLRQEAGLHLFRTRGGQGLPVQVSVSGINIEQAPSSAEIRILRLYQLAGEDRGLIVDLKTGLLGDPALKQDDWKLLLLSRIAG